MKTRSFFFKVLRLAEFLMWRSSLFHFDIVEGKKRVLKIIMTYFYWRDVIAKLGIVNPIKIKY